MEIITVKFLLMHVSYMSDMYMKVSGVGGGFINNSIYICMYILLQSKKRKYSRNITLWCTYGQAIIKASPMIILTLLVLMYQVHVYACIHSSLNSSHDSFLKPLQYVIIHCLTELHILHQIFCIWQELFLL